MIDALTLLRTRKSPKIFDIAAPGPSASDIDAMLAIASRVPDHGKLAPWRFVVFEGEGPRARRRDHRERLQAGQSGCG